jgi:hypothetical protein
MILAAVSVSGSAGWIINRKEIDMSELKDKIDRKEGTVDRFLLRLADSGKTARIVAVVGSVIAGLIVVLFIL